MTREQILSEALRLGLEERAEIARNLLLSLDDLSDEESERLWAEEADRRLEELRTGAVEGVPGKAVLARARSALG